jgi:hypothetical protein
MPLFVMEKKKLHHLVMHCDCKLCVFPSRKQLVNEHLPTMFTKTMERYVLLILQNVPQPHVLLIYGCLNLN